VTATERLVLCLVRACGPLSRADLARRCRIADAGLGTAAADAILIALWQDGLVYPLCDVAATGEGCFDVTSAGRTAFRQLYAKKRQAGWLPAWFSCKGK
jgi:hypothetical protein